MSHNQVAKGQDNCRYEGQKLNLFSFKADLILSPTSRTLVVLATLIDPLTNRIVIDPDSGEHYRLRVVGCDTQVS